MLLISNDINILIDKCLVYYGVYGFSATWLLCLHPISISCVSNSWGKMQDVFTSFWRSIGGNNGWEFLFEQPAGLWCSSTCWHRLQSKPGMSSRWSPKLHLLSLECWSSHPPAPSRGVKMGLSQLKCPSSQIKQSGTALGAGNLSLLPPAKAADWRRSQRARGDHCLERHFPSLAFRGLLVAIQRGLAG